MSAEHKEIKLPKGFKPYDELIKSADAHVTPDWRPFLAW